MSTDTPTIKFNPRVYVYLTGAFDRMEGPQIPEGTLVQVCEGACVGFMPKPHHYICDAETKEFLGLVFRSSLVTRSQDRADN